MHGVHMHVFMYIFASSCIFMCMSIRFCVFMLKSTKYSNLLRVPFGYFSTFKTNSSRADLIFMSRIVINIFERVSGTSTCQSINYLQIEALASRFQTHQDNAHILAIFEGREDGSSLTHIEGPEKFHVGDIFLIESELYQL